MTRYRCIVNYTIAILSACVCKEQKAQLLHNSLVIVRSWDASNMPHNRVKWLAHLLML